MDIKVGDVVHVRVTVLKQGRDGEFWCHARPDTCTPGEIDHGIYINPVEVVHVEPKLLRVGDRVKWGMGGLTGEIRAIGHGDACVQIVAGGQLQIGGLTTQPLSELRAA